MTPIRSEPISLTRDCPAVLIPSGQPVTLPETSRVLVVQTLGGSVTVRTERGWLARIAEGDTDALGLERGLGPAVDHRADERGGPPLTGPLLKDTGKT